MLCMAWPQVVEARRHVAAYQARVASGALPPAQQIAPITNVVFMVSTRTALGAAHLVALRGRSSLSLEFSGHTSAEKPTPAGCILILELSEEMGTEGSLAQNGHRSPPYQSNP